MAPKSDRKSHEGERLEQNLRKLDREMRRLCGVEDFHNTKSKEVKVPPRLGLDLLEQVLELLRRELRWPWPRGS